MSSFVRWSLLHDSATSLFTAIISRPRFVAVIALAMGVVPAWGQFQSPMSISLGFSAGTQASADFNGDGKPDLAIYNPSSGSVSIWLSNGDGSFQNRSTIPVTTAGTSGIVVRTGDFDGDGKQDLLVLGSIFRGNGDGTFGAGIKLQIQNLGLPLTGDFNRDGKTDIAFWHTLNCSFPSCSIAITVLLSQGSGNFQQLPDVVTQGSWQTAGFLVSGDFNGDGRLDLALPVATIGPSMSMIVFLGNGDGTFQPYVESGLGTWTNDVVTGDFNGDGITDLAWVVPEVTLNSQQVSPAQVAVMMSGGGGTFKAPVFSTFGTLPFNDSVVSADFDGDGKSDLALVSRPYVPPQVVNLLFSAGDGTFRGPSTVGINSSSNTGSPTFELDGPSVGDFNGDGRMDLAIPMGEYFTEAILLNSLPIRDFTVGAGPGGSNSQTVTAGQTASYSLALTPSNGFNGTVTLSCSGAPVAAGCAVNPPSLNVSGTGAAPFTVTVTTTARTAAAAVWPRPSGILGWAITLLVGGVFSVWFSAKRKKLFATLAPLIVLALLMAGCGSSSSAPKTPAPTGTPAGTYTMVVTATSGSTVHSQNLTLVVQ